MKMWHSLIKLLRINRAENQLDDEVLFHLEMSTDQKVANGMDREQAYKEALREFGSVEQIKESTRESWGVAKLQACRKDLLFGWRQMLKNKKQAALIILTLSVCIGANTTAYNLLRKLVTHPYAYENADSIVKIGMIWPKLGYNKVYRLSTPNYDRITKQASCFSQQGLISQPFKQDLKQENGLRILTAQAVTPSIWEVVNAKPVVGRFFSDADEPTDLIIGETLWKELRTRNNNLIGEQIILDNTPFTVIGVAPQELFFGTTRADLFMRCNLSPQSFAPEYRNRHELMALGRLKCGFSPDQAAREMEQIYAETLEQYPEDQEDHERTGAMMTARPITQTYAQHIGLVAPAFKTIQVVTLLALLIGCLNISGMILMRNHARLQEFAMRRALGASKRRLAQQLTIEISLYFILGGFGSFLVWKLGYFITSEIPQKIIPGIDIWDMNFDAGLITLLTVGLAALLTSAIPVTYLLRHNLNAAIKASGRTLSGSLNTHRMHAVFVVLQVALSVVVLACVSVLIKNLHVTLAKDIGFEKEGRIALEVSQPYYRYAPTRKEYRKTVNPIREQLLSQIQAMPGVVRATASSRMPVSQQNMSYSRYSRFRKDPDLTEPDQKAMSILVNPGYFEAMGIQLLKGRGFNPSDTLDAKKVVIISQEIAENLFQGENPIGKKIIVGKKKKLRIIGVVDEVQNTPFFADWKKGTLYQPYAQSRVLPPNTTYIVHVEGDPSAHATRLEALVSATVPKATATSTTLEKVYKSATFAHRLPVQISLFCAVIALLITGMGLYGLIGCAIAERTREYSIRMALGAATRNILARIITQYGYLILWGQLLGLLLAATLPWKANPLIPEINTLAPITFMTVSAFLGTIYILACILPARRILKLNPMEALQAE